MSQNQSAHHYTFVNHSGSVHITYVPSVPAPSTGIHHSSDARLEYHGSEGDLIFPREHDGPTQVDVQQDSPLGPLASVILRPTIDAMSVTFALLLPPINMAGKEQMEFQTVAIKNTSFGLLPKMGARMTYEVIPLRGTAHALQDLPQNTNDNTSA